MHRIYTSLILISLLTSCNNENRNQNPLEYALNSKDIKIRQVADNIGPYEVQIKFTQIDRLEDSIVFTDYDFQVNDNNYFYPASTVKFPIAVLALEKLNKIDSLHREMRYYVEGDSVETTFATDISKVFAISDNKANNRLLEFLGQDAINSSLRQKGVSPVRISHRLATDNADEITTKPLIVYLNDSTTATLDGTINTSPLPLKMDKIEKGLGYIDGDSLIQGPFSFALKNRFSINAQHNLLKRIIFPQKFTKSERFNLSNDQREFLLDAMHLLPKRVGYDPVEYYDSYVKFFMFGDDTKTMPNDIKIYNKVGYAYGTLTDCAYIYDTENKVDFLLTATILVNKDSIFNDDKYEYEDVGIPFLAQLGREIHTYELNRKK